MRPNEPEDLAFCEGMEKRVGFIDEQQAIRRGGQDCAVPSISACSIPVPDCFSGTVK